jgi:7-cyano-7-deazaguanine reductase
MSSPRHELLDVFDNPSPGRNYEICHTAHEFTSVCPITGQPDFAELEIRYVADRRCIELKSLKTYLQAYRNEGVFYEALVNQILEDLVTALGPRRLEVRGAFSRRGGLSSVVVAAHPDPDLESGLPAQTNRTARADLGA